MEQPEDKYRAPALDKGLDILELLSGVDSGLTQVEIAKRLGRSPNEFYRMLDRLVRRGYVARMEGDRFGLTLKMFALAAYQAPLRRLVSFAVPRMRDLAAHTLQANHLVVLDRGHVVVLAQQEAPGYWGISIRVGSRVGLTDTGSGLTLLAFASPERRRMILAENVGDSQSLDEVVVPLSLEAQLDAIQSDGGVIMPSRQIAGAFNISAPVLTPAGEALAALTIPYIGFAEETHAPDKEAARDRLLETTRALTRDAVLLGTGSDSN